MSVTRLANMVLKGVVALSLAFLCWLYARSRHQESLDDVLVPVHVALADDDLGRHDVEVASTSRVMVSFTGPPSCMHELRSQLQRGVVQVNCNVVVPEDKQGESSYRTSVRVEAADVPVPPGVSVSLGEGHNTLPIIVHRLVERLVPVRLETVGEGHISQVKAEPGTVLVRGPQDILDQVRAIPTQPYPLPPVPETATSSESLLHGEIGLVKEIDGRPIQCTPASVAFRLRLHPRQRTYDLNDVPVYFLCPANFPWRPKFSTPAAGKVTVRVIGPAADENPQVQAYVDLTQGKFDPGRNREPLRLQLPKDFQPVGEGPQLVTFTLETK
jgi:YbbR-like protein